MAPGVLNGMPRKRKAGMASCVVPGFLCAKGWLCGSKCARLRAAGASACALRFPEVDVDRHAALDPFTVAVPSDGQLGQPGWAEGGGHPYLAPILYTLCMSPRCESSNAGSSSGQHMEWCPGAQKSLAIPCHCASTAQPSKTGLLQVFFVHAN